ncbi:MAG: glycosyltransferase [Oscillospiraceae bacterium]|nr:glycosyltransferase [Oscillospiraceae bacterium]
MPKVSVVVPCYKVEQYLPQMIDSLLGQTLRDLEIILVDDGSPDRSGAICDEYAAKDSRIRVIHKPNGGVGAARNDGLDAATGQWIIFCDSDDYLEPEALDKLLRKGEEADADVVFGDVTLVFENKQEPAVFYKDEFVTDDRQLIDRLIEADFYKYYCYNPPEKGVAFGYGGPWNKLVRRSLLTENDIRFDLRVKGIFDDLIYTAYIFGAAKRVAYVHVPVYGYRQLESSITHTYKSNLLEINTAIFESWQDFMARYGSDGRFLKSYYANVLRRLKASLGLYFFNKKNEKSFRAQRAELKALMASEPYRTALQELDSDKLRYKYDYLLWKAARKGSAWSVWAVYTLFRLKG